MTDVQPIPVYRPTFLTDGGEFRGSLIESPANIFYQKVNASRATLNRLQFQWRSVSDNLLLSPTVMLRMPFAASSFFSTFAVLNSTSSPHPMRRGPTRAHLDVAVDRSRSPTPAVEGARASVNGDARRAAMSSMLLVTHIM